MTTTHPPGHNLEIFRSENFTKSYISRTPSLLERLESRASHVTWTPLITDAYDVTYEIRLQKTVGQSFGICGLRSRTASDGLIVSGYEVMT